MNIFEKVGQLDLSKNAYVIVGGGVLVALGLIEWDEDIDIAVAPEVFNDLKAQGWQQDQWREKPVLKHDVYDVGVGFGDWSLEQLQEDAFWIEGIPFMGLEKLKAWKIATGRPKDLDHVEIIEGYLKGATSE